MSKWSGQDILKFLNIYQNYPILWNSKLNAYTDVNKKHLAYKKIRIEACDNDLGQLTTEEMKKRIKSLRTVYRTVLKKVQSASDENLPEEEKYAPKLIWFEKADSFLNSITRERKSIAVKTEREDSQEEDDSSAENNAYSPKKTNNKVSIKRKKSPSPSMSPRTSDLPKRTSMRIAEHSTSNLQLPSAKPLSIANGGDDEFTQFGKHIAAQLRLLPPVNALLLEEKIQQIITQERIVCLEREPITQNVVTTTQSDSDNDHSNSSHSLYEPEYVGVPDEDDFKEVFRKKYN